MFVLHWNFGGINFLFVDGLSTKGTNVKSPFKCSVKNFWSAGAQGSFPCGVTLMSAIPACFDTILRLISLIRHEKSSSPTGMATFGIQPHVSRAFWAPGWQRCHTEEQLKIPPEPLLFHSPQLTAPSAAMKILFPQLQDHLDSYSCNFTGQFSSIQQTFLPKSPLWIFHYKLLIFPAGAEVQEEWNGIFRG